MSTNKTTNTNDKTTNEKSQNTRKGCKDKEKKETKTLSEMLVEQTGINSFLISINTRTKRRWVFSRLSSNRIDPLPSL